MMHNKITKSSITVKNTNINCGISKFGQALCAAASTALAFTVCVGCSHGDATEGSTATASATGAASPTANSGSETSAPTTNDSGVSEAELKDARCGMLVGDVSILQQLLIVQHLSVNSDLYRDFYKNELKDLAPGGQYYNTYDGDTEALKIARAVPKDPFSKVTKRKIKKYCGPYFDKNLKHSIRDFSAKTPNGLDWNL